MAFNWQTFRTRTISALVFVGVMLAGLLWNQWSFLVLFSIIHFGAWWEYLKLVEKIYKTSFHSYLKLGLMVIGYGILLWFCGPGYHINGYGLKENISLPVSAAGFALLLFGIFQKTPVRIKPFAVAALGLLYISLSWGLMLDFRSSWIDYHDKIFELDYGYILPTIIILSLWMNDTMAYLVGSLIGRTPLSPISPKKTWEGTIGGVLLCVAIMAFILAPWLLKGMAGDTGFPIVRQNWFIIPAIAAVTGTFGDLLESKLKRMAGVKDSGMMMPGHGGFLDRFDSLLFATPFVWLYVTLFMK